MKFDIVQTVWQPKNFFKKTARLVSLFENEFNEDGGAVTPYNQEVTMVAIKAQPQLNWIPESLIDFFPNLTGLCLIACGLKKISRNNLRLFTMLKEIFLMEMEIEALPGDLFVDLKNLEIISLCRNEIKFIGKNIFSHLKNLEFVNLSENPSINLIYDSKNYKTQTSITRITKIEELNAIINGIYHSKLQNLSSDVQKVIHIDYLKDFTIKIGENEFKVHKLMLAARSGTFAEMIKENPHADEIILEGIEVEVFKIILDYIYKDKMPQNYNENSHKVFAAAGKLKIEKLKNEVGKFMSENVNTDNMVEILKYAVVYDHKELKEKSFEEIKKFMPDKHLSDEIMSDFGKIEKMVMAKKLYEEKLRRIQEEYENML